MALVLILVGEVIALCRGSGVHLLHFRQWLTHQTEGHCHIIRCALRLARGMNQAVQLVTLVGVRTCPSQLRLVKLRQSLRVGDVGDAEDVVYRIIAVLVLHQRAAAACKCHVLQPLTLLVVSVGSLGAVAELLIDGMAVLIVAYLCHDNAFLICFVACQTLHLSGGVVVVGDDLSIRVGHRPHTVPAVVGGKISVTSFIINRKHSKL